MLTPEDYGIKKYTWNNGLLDVHHGVTLYDKQLIKLPFNFGVIDGFFWCDKNKLTSLEGCPQVVKGNFDCSHNLLTSLEWCPQVVEGNFNCGNNDLISLNGCPKMIKGYFNCSANNLESLSGGPEVVNGDFNCSGNELKSLEGCPAVISKSFFCAYNELTSLEGGPKVIYGDFVCSNNKIKTIENIVKFIDSVSGDFAIRNNDFNLSIDDMLLLTKKYTRFYKSVDVVENKDQQSTIDNLEKKIFLANKILGAI